NGVQSGPERARAREVGAAQRTLDGEDRSETLERGRKGAGWGTAPDWRGGVENLGVGRLASCGPAQLLKQPVLGLLHAPGGFGVAPESGDALQGGQAEAGTQVVLGLGQRQQRLQRGLVAAVAAAFSSLGIHLDVGLRTR